MRNVLAVAAAAITIVLAAVYVFTIETVPVGANSSAIDIGTRLELFVDDELISGMKGVSFKLHNPVPREVVAKLDAPWEGDWSAYFMVMKDGDTYRMYYRGGGETTQEVTSMLVSKDGINWTRPNLGLWEFEGSKENNIVFRGQHKSYWESHNFTMFKDDNPAVTAEWKYKAVGLGRQKLPDGDDARALLGLTSPDAIHWKLIQEKPIITFGSFDSQNVVFWDKNIKEYACYFRTAHNNVRTVSRTTSKDFVNWSQPDRLDFGNTPLEQFYTNGIVQYFRDPYWYLGFPMRFVPERTTIGADNRAIDGLSDAVFVSSRDGVHFKRTFMDAFIRPGPDQLNWGRAHGNNTPVWGLVPTSPEEISIYWCEHYQSLPQIRRGTLRTDGFISINAPYKGGEFTTKPVKFGGNKLVINYSTSAVGSIRVELQDGNGKALDGYSIQDCPEIYGDEIVRTVSWKNGSDLSGIAGKSVKLKFTMKDADLYSMRFVR